MCFVIQVQQLSVGQPMVQGLGPSFWTGLTVMGQKHACLTAIPTHPWGFTSVTIHKMLVCIARVSAF